MTQELGDGLKNARMTQGLSLKAAAEPAGISATYLQKLESGQTKSPSPNVLHRLSKTLNVPYTSLMGLAGYVVPEEAETAASPFEHALSASDLTADERRAVAAFISHLRSQRDKSEES